MQVKIMKVEREEGESGIDTIAIHAQVRGDAYTRVFGEFVVFEQVKTEAPFPDNIQELCLEKINALLKR